MILVVILVVAWLVILGPSLLRRRAGDGVSSISHFHRQLRVLEHSGGQPIVLPAYRLQSVDGGRSPSGSRYPDVASVPVLSVVGADRLPRPALAFLGDDPAASRTTAGPPAAAPTPDRPPATPVEPVRVRRDPVEAYRPLDPELRGLARRRRRDTLTVLVLVTGLSFLIGCIPGAQMAWVVTLIAGLALSAYVAMLVHMRSMADERERKLHYLRPDAGGSMGHRYDDRYGFDPDDDIGFPDPASPEQMAAYWASRYDHPARQAAAR